ncbi:hypothetical protein Y032_0043g866 [Ancylostoma ceylanicum]|uniref:Uncharacterized protein n=1 Tax=Ancylostoma ceylanicum TaxID=53326 RepID=A0A016UFQ2_9BILA|nr:hypothetical protein Y032_0043g866 [Ancylostoma ceylanicum]
MDGHKNINVHVSSILDACLTLREITVLLKKKDGLRVRFLSIAAAESLRDLLDPLTSGMLSPYPSFRFRRDGAVAQSVYLFEKDRTSGYRRNR